MTAAVKLAPEVSLVVNQVYRAVRNRVYSGTDEKQVQAAIGQALQAAKLPFEAEYRLSPQDIPDFLVDGSVVIEVKMKASRALILRQLSRYARHEQVRALMLVSPRFTTIGGMPDQVLQVPLYVAPLPGPGFSL